MSVPDALLVPDDDALPEGDVCTGNPSTCPYRGNGTRYRSLKSSMRPDKYLCKNRPPPIVSLVFKHYLKSLMEHLDLSDLACVLSAGSKTNVFEQP